MFPLTSCRMPSGDGGIISSYYIVCLQSALLISGQIASDFSHFHLDGDRYCVIFKTLNVQYEHIF